MRFNASHPPRTIPYRSIAAYEYAEHVGVNLQLGGKRGEMSRRYAVMPMRAREASGFLIAQLSLVGTTPS